MFHVEIFVKDEKLLLIDAKDLSRVRFLSSIDDKVNDTLDLIAMQMDLESWTERMHILIAFLTQ